MVVILKSIKNKFKRWKTDDLADKTVLSELTVSLNLLTNFLTTFLSW